MTREETFPGAVALLDKGVLCVDNTTRLLDYETKAEVAALPEPCADCAALELADGLVPRTAAAHNECDQTDLALFKTSSLRSTRSPPDGDLDFSEVPEKSTDALTTSGTAQFIQNPSLRSPPPPRGYLKATDKPVNSRQTC